LQSGGLKTKLITADCNCGVIDRAAEIYHAFGLLNRGYQMLKFLRLSFALFTLTLSGHSAFSDDDTAAVNDTLGVDADAFVEGNLYFLMYHELGHAIISEFDVPVIGREEDAVDRLATWMMTPDDKKEKPEYLTAAMQGWFITANDVPLEKLAWWDEHGTDQQRGYQIACLLYGADAEQFGDIAEKANLPEDRRASCIDESAKNTHSWETVLGPLQYGDDEKPPSTPVSVSYADTTEFETERKYIEDLGVLNDVTELMNSTYKFKDGIVVAAEECGQANAFWNPGERKLTLCYELVRDYLNIAEKYK
jgi:Putative metallopeptidase